MARDDAWVQKELRTHPRPKPTKEALKRAERHVQGTFTVVKADNRE